MITSAKQTTALQGMGGVGKSVLAAAFARACETRRAFTDGVIIWLTFGQQPDLVRNLALVGQAFDDDPQHYLDLPRGKARLAEVLADKVCLFVLDDIWDMTHAEAFVNALGPRCRLLITTRDGGLATGLGAQEHRLDVLSDDAALKLLADWSEQTVDSLPPEARAVADECGNLPFALALCGAMARDGTPWADLLDALRQADLAFIEVQFPNYPYPNVLKSLKVSVDALARIDPAWEKHYLELAVFPADEAVPEAAVMTLWLHTDGLNERSARKLLTTLERKALLRLEGEAPQRRVSLHDLQHDYVRAAQDDLTGLHGELLEAYRQKCADGWPTGPDDGHFFEHLAYHLVEAGRKEELRQLLLDFDWLQAKLEATDATALIADFDFLADDADLRLVQGALRLSAHVLAQDRTQLAGQLLGRLMTKEGTEINGLIEQANQIPAGIWLRPMTPSLPQPGGSLLRTLTGHTRTVYAVAVTPDGKRAISASADATLKIWDLSSDKELFTLQGHTHYVYAVAVTPNGQLIISGSEDGTLKVWDLETGAEQRTLAGLDGPVRAVAVTSDGQRVIGTSVARALGIWDLESGTEILIIPGAGGYAVAITPDGAQVIAEVIAARRSGIKVWDLESGAELRTLASHEYTITALAVTPDGQRLISASGDTLKVWDLENGNELYSIHHPSHIYALAVTPDAKRLISASDYSTLRVWDLESGTELSSLPRSINLVRSVAIIPPDGTHIITGANDGTLRLWELGRDTKMRSFPGHTFRVMAVAVTPDSRRAISASYDGTLKVWDLETGVELHTLEGHNEHVYAVAATPDGKHAVSASADATLKAWDIENDDEPLTITGHTRHVHAVAVTSDGKHIVSASHDGTLKVWDVDSGAELFSLICESGTFDRVMAIPDGRCLVSALNDGTMKILYIDHEVRLLNLQSGHTNNIDAMAVSSDGKRAISHSYDGTKVWDLDSGAELLTLQSATHEDIRDVALTPDGLHAVLAWENGSLEVWDLTSEAKLHTLIN